MLRIKVPISPEGWDEEKQEFVEPEVRVLKLEHSLVSISKWESKYCRSFIDSKEMTYEETLFYVECMTLQEDIDPEIYSKLTRENVDEIRAYIYSPMTATKVREVKNGRHSGESTTSELIYYWMIESGIPFECQHWHLNRLLTLIKVCSTKNTPNKKMSKGEIMRQNAAINAANRARFNSKG